MNSLAFITHPSVRIKGSETNYSPSLCLDERCPIKAPHLHCPFCVKTDAYQDPVILKAHYRVKHVDKGIEFAGLKILRCCDHCDIVGIIKGEKRFKGAHWHCYRCRNGFNRRDEAIKHYKTHFRNPQTTFQIQITQDLNLPLGVKQGGHQHQDSINQQNIPLSLENPLPEIIHPVLAQATLSETNVIAQDGNIANSKYQKVKVKDEPLLTREDAEDQSQTIMIIQGDHLDSAFSDHIIHSEVSAIDKDSVDPNLLPWEIRFRMEEEEKNEYKARVEEYKSQVEELQQRVQELESQQQTGHLRVHDLLASLSMGDEEKQILAQQISKYLEELQEQQDEELDERIPSQQLTNSEGIMSDLSSVTEQTANQISSIVQSSLTPVSVVTHLSQIAEPYQVIASDSNNHNDIVNHSEENPIPDLVCDGSSNRKGSSAEHISNSREGGEDLFQQVTSVSHNSDLIVTQVVSSNGQSDILSQKFLVDSGIPQSDNAPISLDASGEGRLLQVVSAPNGQGDHGSEAFIMETECGQIIIQRSESSINNTNKILEPDSKRQRIS